MGGGRGSIRVLRVWEEERVCAGAWVLMGRNACLSSACPLAELIVCAGVQTIKIENIREGYRGNKRGFALFPSINTHHSSQREVKHIKCERFRITNKIQSVGTCIRMPPGFMGERETESYKFRQKVANSKQTKG